ncbi:MAG: hypothetical protein WCG78_01645, partial [Candidatus Omnitrophota bacterium]
MNATLKKLIAVVIAGLFFAQPVLAMGSRQHLPSVRGTCAGKRFEELRPRSFLDRVVPPHETYIPAERQRLLDAIEWQTEQPSAYLSA